MTTFIDETRTLPRLRIGLAGLFMLVFAVYFWTDSRYPQLNEKAMMSGTIQLEDPLSFEAAIQFEPTAPILEKIGLTTYNWMKTNRRGMTFGVLFGALFLTLLRYLPRRSFANGFANSLLGMFVGAPLGVCVNCAAPIAKGIFSSGARAETALSAMVASPTLNVVVVSMAFAVLPFYMAVTKLVLSFIVILIVVPLLVRYLPREQQQATLNTDAACLVPLASRSNRTLASEFSGFVSDFAQDFWYILRMTVPLMLLAGLLGAVVGNLVPLELLKDLPVSLPVLMAVAIVGLILPVPMAFDVVIAATLINAGLPIGIVMVLVFTLGSFSIYSFIIVATSLSWRAAFILSAAIAVLAVVAGFGADWYQNRALDSTLDYLRSSVTAPTSITPT